MASPGPRRCTRDRRSFLLGGLAPSLLAAPAGLHGQGQAGARIHRIGYLSPGTYTPGNDLDAFRSALTDLGWSEPRNIVIVQRWSGADDERLPALAGELAALPVDVIVTISTPAALAAHKATNSIPIVMAG